MLHIHRLANPRLDFQPDDISVKNGVPGYAFRFGQRKKCRDHDSRGVAGNRRETVVEVERMRRGPVRQRGPGRSERFGLPDDRCGAVAPKRDRAPHPFRSLV